MKRIILTAAAFFAFAGVGVAADRYTITSVKQISPHVRAQLRGKRGPKGLQGAPGQAGPQGQAGITNLAVNMGSVYEVDGTTQTLTRDDSSPATVTAMCNGSDLVLSGGFTGDAEIVMSSSATTDRHGWAVTAEYNSFNSFGSSHGTITPVAYCVSS